MVIHFGGAFGPLARRSSTFARTDSSSEVFGDQVEHRSGEAFRVEGERRRGLGLDVPSPTSALRVLALSSRRVKLLVEERGDRR
jgi:hypothetical protein